jgi:hypothetical protein
MRTSRPLGTPARKLALIGGVGGLAWSAAIRAYMVEIAGRLSHFEWAGTFLQILLPGVVVGVLLGVAEYVRRTGGRRGWRWLAAAPILFAVAPLLSPGALQSLITTGLGGGALVLPITGMLGGFAVSGRGPVWGRIVTGVLALALVVAAPLGQAFFAPRGLELTEPRGAWAALLLASLEVVLALACSIPHRKVVAASLG